MVREELIAENTGLLGDSNIQELSGERFVGTLVYPVADPDGGTLTVRQREGDPRVTPAGLAWRLVERPPCRDHATKQGKRTECADEPELLSHRRG